MFFVQIRSWSVLNIVKTVVGLQILEIETRIGVTIDRLYNYLGGTRFTFSVMRKTCKRVNFCVTLITELHYTRDSTTYPSSQGI